MIQGSDEWLMWRGKGVGSSDIGSIMGINPYKTVRELYLEKTGLIKPEDLSNKPAIKKGVRLEPVARDFANEYFKCTYEVKTFESSYNKLFRYSSDGVCEDNNSIIEIKCMGLKNHAKVVETMQMPEYYYPQCQWGLMVSGFETCHFIAYSEEHEKKTVVISFERDNHLFDVMTDKSLRFLKAVEARDYSIIR